MSIEQTLERIAAGIEKLIEMQGGATVAPVTQAPVAAPMPGPSGAGPGQTIPEYRPPLAPQTPVAMSPGPHPATPIAPAPVVQPVPPVAPTPVGGPPQLAAVPSPTTPAPAVNTDLLDQIRDAANQFHRAHPERAGEVWQILANNGSAGGIDTVPAQNQPQALAQLQKLS